MSATPTLGGSSVSARTRTPSIQLHALADNLAKSLEPPSGVTGIDALPLISVENDHLVVNPRSVLQRFFAHKDFIDTFSPGTDSGFIRDMEMPPPGTTAKVGGRLVPGSEGQVSKSIERLHQGISDAISRALGGKDINELCFDSVGLGLRRIAESAEESVPLEPRLATLVPVQFASETRHADRRAKDVARLFTAIETVNGADCLEAFLANIATKLRREDMDEDTIDAILANLRHQREREGSQLSRFFDFLDDEALARVRLQVSMRLMQAISEQASPLLGTYVARVVDCYERFGSPDGEALLLDVTSAFAQAGRTDLAEQLRKALFYGCLSVWPEWSAQLFETRGKSDKGFQTVREVSYRFRVNGRSPLTGDNAFDSRLELLRNRLDPKKPTLKRLPSSLAQLIFLHLVVPTETNDSLDLSAEAIRVSDELKRDPIATIDHLLKSLRNRSSVVRSLADELVRMMKEKSRRIIEATSRQIDSFTVSVHRNVVDWDAVISMASANTDVLIKSERGEPTTAWFAHLVISEAPVVPGSIASYSVQTELKERSLAPAGEPSEIPMNRSVEESLLPIRLVPYKWDKSIGQWTRDGNRLELLDGGRGIEVQYDLRLLHLKRAKDGEKQRTEQFRSATAAAFALLVYITL